MELSEHNIVSRIHNSNAYFIVNALSGHADVLTPEESRRLLNREVLNDPEYIEKGYVVDPVVEKKQFRHKYLDFIDARETDEIQIFYVPTYACNFNCAYCYQEGYAQHGRDHTDVTNAFFEYVLQNFNSRRKYITLFGGEPLLPGALNTKFLEDFIEKCNRHQLDLAVVTNGYTLEEYLPLLAKASIREIQVTLDGTEIVHDSRRPLKNGTGTFASIVRGIDLALEKEIPINLRVVLDRDNINNLPELAQFAIEKGWTGSPFFKTQLGRNYELHYCQSQQSKLYSRIDLYKDLYSLILQHPPILEFHTPAFSLSKFLFERGELPEPLYDACPGAKTEWAFDFSGKIYSCTATVGKPGEELGTFFPVVKLNEALVATWQQRDVLSIKACGICNLRLACGGGCASVAFNRENDLHAPDCRPVKELLELGLSLYSGEPDDSQTDQ
jgi:uncharacterized protein